MIDHVTLGGTVYPVSIGFASLRQVEMEKGISLLDVIDAVGKNASVVNTVYICTLAINEGFRKEKETRVLSEVEVADLLDEPEKLTEIAGLIGNQLGKIFAPLIAEGQKSKKKLP